MFLLLNMFEHLKDFNFTIYGPGGHVGHATKLLDLPKPWRLHIRFGYNWPTGFREKSFETADG